jgi:hypothetical protein
MIERAMKAIPSKKICFKYFWLIKSPDKILEKADVRKKNVKR